MDDPLLLRIRALAAEDPALGYRALHAKLKQEPEFQDVGLKRVQTTLQQVREAPAAAALLHLVGAAQRRAGPGENFWTAASDGDIARVEELMALEGFTASSKDENGYTPVMAAASYGHFDLLRLLLESDTSGTAVNACDSDGDAPLHHVAAAEELDAELLRPVIGLLLQHRADPALQNSEGKTCLDLCGAAVMEGVEEEPVLNIEFIKVMDEHGVKFD
ncbi:unnamed protein product [Polarella glacialis]|uniref:Uncharacterized protein n=1 Tax=Polarella glacialis TaxID=89957 RepID=A0A813KWI4_POLGL|nr:unnamed protein product [Polarella glacialis]